jgi:DNA-binding Lrp family transcriptional regulator
MVHFNKDLIFLLSEGAREKLKSLSGLLKKTPQRLKYSLKILEKEGVVHSPHCVFDYSYLGLIMFRVYFKGGYISEKDKGKIIEKLSGNPYVVSIYELSGEFDLAIEIESKNPSRFNKELKNVADLIPTLNNYKVLLNIVTHIYPKLYLVKDVDTVPWEESEIIVGGDREVLNFSNSELMVMKSLLHHPRMRFTRLARESQLNIKTLMAEMRDLSQKRIIKGFRYLIDYGRLGVSKYRLFLKLHNLSKERDSQLLEYFKRTRGIVQVSKTVGDWDMEVDIEAFESSRIRFLINQLREDFKDVIQSFNLIEFIRYHKKSYLPDYLFENVVAGKGNIEIMGEKRQ